MYIYRSTTSGLACLLHIVIGPCAPGHHEELIGFAFRCAGCGVLLEQRFRFLRIVRRSGSTTGILAGMGSTSARERPRSSEWVGISCFFSYFSSQIIVGDSSGKVDVAVFIYIVPST